MSKQNNPMEELQALPFTITREFAAPLEMVWRAWTEAGQLQQWFGPKGFKTVTFSFDLRVGRGLHSCMRSPEGGEIWGKWVFREVVPPRRLVWINSFSDKDGGISRHPWNPAWPLELFTETTFAENNGNTVVTLKWAPHNATDDEIRTFNAAHESMTNGWGGTFDQLATHLNCQ